MMQRRAPFCESMVLGIEREKLQVTELIYQDYSSSTKTFYSGDDSP